MKRYLCRFPGCRELLEKSGYCKVHTKQNANKTRKPFEGAIRSNESLYRTYKWKQLQKKVIARDERCNYCGIPKTECQLQAHHLIPPRGNEDLFYDEQNLVAVCYDCHAVITQMEINSRKK
jgi:5-methylcytosine-specific restriction protein A